MALLGKASLGTARWGDAGLGMAGQGKDFTMTTKEGAVVKLAREASYLGGVLDHAIVDLDSSGSGYANELRKFRDDLSNAFGDNGEVDPPEQHNPSSLGGDDPGAIPVWKWVEMEVKRRDNEIEQLWRMVCAARECLSDMHDDSDSCDFNVKTGTSGSGCLACAAFLAMADAEKEWGGEQAIVEVGDGE